MGKSIVDHLLGHLDDNAGTFYRLWRKPGDTPATVVAEFASMIEDANSELEDDYFELGNLLENMVAGLDADERYEFGSGILHMKKKYRDKYS